VDGDIIYRILSSGTSSDEVVSEVLILFASARSVTFIFLMFIDKALSDRWLSFRSLLLVRNEIGRKRTTVFSLYDDIPCLRTIRCLFGLLQWLLG
jgi:hypothetical protein